MIFARRLLVLSVALTAFPSVSAAQLPNNHWGIAASVAPWQAGDQFKALYDARALDLSGRDLRIGLTRGHTLGGEWAFLYVKRTIAGGATLNRRGLIYEFQPGVEVKAFMAERYGAFGTFGRRVQIGGVLAGGVGQAQGTARRLSDGLDFEAAEVLTLFAQEVKFQLMLRAEIAVAFRLAPGAKLRVSGGVDWPGTTVVTVTGMYFFGEK
jgi:hypothetical protein